MKSVASVASVAWVLSALAAGMFGCSSEDSCSPGQTLQDHVCVPMGESAGGAGGESGATSGGASGGECDSANWGTMCTDTAECGCPTDYCAIQPGETSGFCTRTGCVEDESICPQEWGCLDLSHFQEGLPSICTES